MIEDKDCLSPFELLLKMQSELKAPKGQFNSFGKYKYRSCENIFEAVKPLLSKYKAVLTITDSIVLIGERYYIEATATIKSGVGDFSVKAYARESLTKKGMDDSQITGAASSYARKYALNGLLLIDDTKDADNDDSGDGDVQPPDPDNEKKITGAQKAQIYNLLKCLKIEHIINLPDEPDYRPVTEWLMDKKIVDVEKMSFEQADRLHKFLTNKHNSKTGDKK